MTPPSATFIFFLRDFGRGNHPFTNHAVYFAVRRIEVAHDVAHGVADSGGLTHGLTLPR